MMTRSIRLLGAKRVSMRLRSFAVAALALCTSQAFATIVSEASVSNIHVWLTDLDPNDGIAPSITFLTGGAGATTWISTAGTTQGTYRYRTQSASNSPIGLQDSSFGHTVQALVAGTGVSPEGGGFAASSTVLGSAYGAVGTTVSQRADFRLSPMTAVNVSADLVAGYTKTGATVPAHQWVDVWLGFDVWISDSSFDDRDGIAIERTTDPYNNALVCRNACSDPNHWPGRESLTFTASNTTRASHKGAIWGGATVQSYVTSAVPEPSNLALLVAGLCALFVLSRRRSTVVGLAA